MELENQIEPQVLIDIARKAGDKILEIYHGDTTGWEVRNKADDSPLTLADQLSNEIIDRELKRNFPDIPVISEENKETPYEKRREYQYFWLVDPLDGTREFIKRNGEFTVNIALVKEDVPVAGVVYPPEPGAFYWAIKGKGAYLRENEKQDQLLKASSFHLSGEGLRIVCSRSHLNDATRDFVERFNSPELVSMGSSLKFMLVAGGKAEIYPRIAPTMEWDTGAAQIIVEEAGGKVVNFENDQPLRYNKEVMKNGHFVVYGNVLGY